MTQAQYIEQNKKGYEGDTFIHEEIRQLVKRFGITHIFETGTYRGATAKRLSEFCPVSTVEIVPENYAIAKQELSTYPNIYCVLGNSVEWLDVWLANLNREPTEIESILWYCDSHWLEDFPLLNELAIVAKHKVKPVIVIHDFKVPGTDFGFDSYKGKPLDLNYILPSLVEIYGENGCDWHFNSQADGARRGVIYIYPS